MAVSDQIHVRLPSVIKERLRKKAKRNRRSLNAEIVHRLEKSLSQEEGREKSPG